MYIIRLLVELYSLLIPKRKLKTPKQCSLKNNAKILKAKINPVEQQFIVQYNTKSQMTFKGKYRNWYRTYNYF